MTETTAPNDSSAALQARKRRIAAPNCGQRNLLLLTLLVLAWIPQITFACSSSDECPHGKYCDRYGLCFECFEEGFCTHGGEDDSIETVTESGPSGCTRCGLDCHNENDSDSTYSAVFPAKNSDCISRFYSKDYCVDGRCVECARTSLGKDSCLGSGSCVGGKCVTLNNNIAFRPPAPTPPPTNYGEGAFYAFIFIVVVLVVARIIRCCKNRSNN
mmetsp:Transcript_45426/g.110440  ORF Transcript_45426/g.110440 Transcript_45426/m.110440 type:complete len:215 (-) Transcript_45426:165-809(-)